jgi:hypothetical protein
LSSCEHSVNEKIGECNTVDAGAIQPKREPGLYGVI